jgi:mannose-6-phosphate isomerase
LPEGVSGIANGPLAGRSLHDAMDAWGERLVGPHSYQGRFPLLVKFIHSEDDLSVQVHPSDEDCARQFPGEHGKDECWLIVDAAPDATILHGTAPGATLEAFDRHVAANTTLKCLRRVSVKAGDATRIAPGTVHAVCRGVVLLEIQQPSDSTFRIDDYGRLEEGKPRPLHTEQARQVIRFDDNEPALIEAAVTEADWGRSEAIVAVPAYRIDRVTLQQAVEMQLPSDSPIVLVALDGPLTIAWNEHRLALDTGDTLVVPACMDRLRLDVGSAQTRVVLSGIGPDELVRFTARD